MDRLKWLDMLKGLAIIAVVVDHMKLAIKPFSIYSVSMFFLILGFNAYASIERHGDASIIGRFKSCSRFLVLYMIATVIYCLVNAQFDVQKVYEHIVYFSASPPFYFCAIYLQITLISGLLYKVTHYAFERARTYAASTPFGEGAGLLPGSTASLCVAAFLLIVFYSLSELLKNVVIFPYLHGGGRFLFGSTYLFLTVVGMLLARAISAIEGRRGFVLYCSALVLILSPLYIGSIWSNPPLPMTCVYAVSLFLLIASLGCEWNNRLSRFIMLCGKYSVHIFMYHLLVKHHLGLRSKHVTFFIALLVPVLIGFVIDRCLEKKARSAALSSAPAQ